MTIHTKYWTTLLPISVEEAWSFFSKPENLKLITPPEMGFEIQSNVHELSMYPGMIIQYKIKPLFNISMDWATLITQVQQDEYFVDEQLNGPYSYWHHEHHFKATAHGTEMNDYLYYALPLGFIGNWVNNLFISNKIDSIFAYRAQAIKTQFL